MKGVDDGRAPAKFVITEDPALNSQKGDSLRFQQVSPSFGAAFPRATDVGNWQLFEGMLLAITFSDGERDWVLGSAVLVAPGVALCAAHVINTHIDELLQSKVGVICFGIASSGAQAWRITTTTIIPGLDVCFLGLQGASALPSNRMYSQATVTTRLPAIGEKLMIAGFRASNKSFPRRVDHVGRIELAGCLTISSGVVTEQYPQGRDTLLAPWPSIEIDCPAWGGMSGGPVFDSRGFIVGLISRSMETEEEPSPMLSSLLWPVLGHRFDGGWPISNLQKSLLDLNGTVCQIDRPDAVTVGINEVTRQVRTTYSAWT